MKQLLILSGKGGTGKTTIAGAFIHLAGARAYADCDVDAPNLHLLQNSLPKPKQTDYYAMEKAFIDPEICNRCGTCRTNCRFEAIEERNGHFRVNSYACEGCGLCSALCSAGAISLQKSIAGELSLFKDRDVFSTASLKMGSGTTGKLVTEVKNQLRNHAEGAELAIIDGSPGIGCPVIASLSGADMVLIVAEPSFSGLSDLERIVRTAQRFRPVIAVCVNKFDTNLGLTEKIEAFCQEQKLFFAGKIPFDPAVMQAINKGKNIIETDCAAGRAVIEVFKNTMSWFPQRHIEQGEKVR